MKSGIFWYLTFLFLIFISCSESAKLTSAEDSSTENQNNEVTENESCAQNARSNSRVITKDQEELQVGVYFMPSWNVSGNPKEDIDSFWSCLRGRGNCRFLSDPGSWGPKGRIYNRQYPYEGPYLEKKPIPELKGFYERDDPEVARMQLKYMRDYGIDFFAYNWFFGRHYYYHKDFAPQAKLFYPEGWETDKQRDGRVLVPGLESWESQLQVLLSENEKLPEKDQMKFAINWCDDSEDRWIKWLEMSSPKNINGRINYKGETPNKDLYLKVHDKITLIWIEKYFRRKDYLRDERGRPVVYFYFPHDTEARASYYNIGLDELLERSKNLARKYGFPGIKFIAVTSGAMTENLKPYAMPTTWRPKNASKPWEGGTYGDRMFFQDYVSRLKGLGFDGLTAYIYHDYFLQNNKSYQDMRATYRGHWNKWTDLFKGDAGFDYQLPVAMGWDRRPAGGTWPQQTGFPSEPQKDRVISTKTTFKAKLQEAKAISEKYKATNGNTIMVCCWNEYLEGNHIEPTVGHGFDYLEAIREVFSP